MIISIDEFYRNNNLRDSDVNKTVIRLSGILGNHIFKKDKIFIDSYAQNMIIAKIRKGRKKNNE